MAQVSVPGGGLWLPGMLPIIVNPPATSNAAFGPIDAAGEKLAMVGRVWLPAHSGSKDIRRVGFRFGTVVKAGGSGLTISLQDVDLINGPPVRPDGVQDQTVAVANGDATFDTGLWHRSGALNADRNVTHGDRLAVVVEYDGGGRLGADTVSLSTLQAVNSVTVSPLETACVLFTAAWAILGTVQIPILVLEMSDGTFGTLEGCFPCTTINTHTFNVGTLVADEYALVVTPVWPCKIDGLWGIAGPVAGADFEQILYDGVVALQTVSVDANAIIVAGSRLSIAPIAETALVVGTTYYVGFRPTTANNISVYSFDVFDANHLTCHPAGIGWTFTTRLNLGAWAAPTATRRLFAGVRMSSFDDGAGGGGGNIFIVQE